MTSFKSWLCFLFGHKREYQQNDSGSFRIWDWECARCGHRPEMSADQQAFEHYHRWAAAQCCYKCGAKAADRERDQDGRYLRWWVTEIDCGCPDIPWVGPPDARTKFIAEGGDPRIVRGG